MLCFSFTKEDRSSGGIIGLSDRDCFIGCGSVVCLFLSLVIALIYWIGAAKGWW